MNRPLRGNIYCDGFWDQGHYYRDYSIDCANCGREDILELRRHRTKTAARLAGWRQSQKHGQWLCPDCAKLEDSEVIPFDQATLEIENKKGLREKVLKLTRQVKLEQLADRSFGKLEGIWKDIPDADLAHIEKDLRKRKGRRK